jgi:hypothetical protein
MKKIVFCLIILTQTCMAQEIITVTGKISDASDRRISIPGCIVVNMRTQQGILANEDGTFSVRAMKTDTLAFRTIGYELKFISLKDSVLTAKFSLSVLLKRQSYQLEEITIVPHRTLDSISKDINKLGYDESKFMLQGVDAIQSPITYLYQYFSRKERSRREVAFMMNEDERKKLMHELLEYYVNAGFLPLRDRDFDSFINFCAITEAQLKTLTQYEMAVYIKKKYENFSALHR